MTDNEIALKLSQVEFRRQRRVILADVNLEIRRGEKWVLFGPNGIGKSSLVQMMSTRGFPSSGNVDLLGNRLGKVDVFSYRNRIGLSWAELSRAFPPNEDPLDAVVTALTATTGRWRDEYTAEDFAKARGLMEEFGIAVLPKPISRASFSSALHLLRASHSRLLQMQEQARKLRKQLEELRLVSRAKCILIETGGLTEPEAHAFLEKQAMNRRMTKVDVARELLQARE